MQRRARCPCRNDSRSSVLLLSDRSITARRDCAFTNVHFGYVSDEQSTATVNERANDRALSAKYAEEPQLCGGTLSFVIRGGDRLSAVVRFGSNMSYVRGKPAAGWLPRTSSRRSPWTIGGCINVRRSRRCKRKKKEQKKSNNNLDNEAMPVDRRRRRGRKCAKGAERQLGDRWKKKENGTAIVTARMCLPRPGPVARMNQ